MRFRHAHDHDERRIDHGELRLVLPRLIAENQPAAEAAMARMDAAAAERGDEPAPPVVRAMENARGPLAETHVHATVAAATGIEQA